MAWQYATEQGVYIPTFVSTDSKTPTTPTNPVVTISKDGAGLGAVAGTVAAVTDFGVYVALAAGDTTCATGAIKVTSDNCDPATLVFVTEGNYTADRATAIDTIAADVAGLDGDAMYNPAGTGVHTVTVTVKTSGSVTFEGVRVSASGVDETNQYTETTDTNGQVVFHLNAGTWRFVAAASKAQSGGAVNQVVDGIESVTLTVVANTIPAPASPSNFTLYNYETEVENGDIPLVGMLVQIVGLSGGRVSATNNLIRNLMYHTSTTGADGMWSFQIPLALDGYQIDVLRMTVGDDGLPHSEIMKAVIDTTKVSSGILSFADLSPE